MRPGILAIFSLTLLLGGCSERPAALNDFLRSYIATHPGTGAQDVYKLLYQGHFGPGHAIPDAERALLFLREEAAELERPARGTGGTGDDAGDAPHIGPASSAPPSPDETLLEACLPGGAVVRVNLRPWIAAGRSLEDLAAAMVRSADAMQPDTADFLRAWEHVRLMVEKGELSLDGAELDAFARKVRANGYPAVHHSEEYRRRYAPAYRVVLRRELGAAGEAVSGK